jgi:hypothetical protein
MAQRAKEERKEGRNSQENSRWRKGNRVLSKDKRLTDDFSFRLSARQTLVAWQGSHPSSPSSHKATAEMGEEWATAEQ